MARVVRDATMPRIVILSGSCILLSTFTAVPEVPPPVCMIVAPGLMHQGPASQALAPVTAAIPVQKDA